MRGDKVRTFVGQGDRQYLTGLKVGGKRIFILVDTSASMLDTTIVNIIRQRNLPKSQRIRAEKWQRVVSTVDWLTSQIPPSSRFQIYSFNESSQPLLPGTKSKWLPAAGGNYLNKAFNKLKRIAPEKGTSLYHAFASLKAMRPRPDNVFLLTDGLPTQGKTKSGRGKVSGEQRLKYFRTALKQLIPGVPVNTILFPIEGDPYASSTFWKLAIRTKGSPISNRLKSRRETDFHISGYIGQYARYHHRQYYSAKKSSQKPTNSRGKMAAGGFHRGLADQPNPPLQPVSNL